MKVHVDADLCTGDELCADACPGVFEMKNGISVAKVKVVPANLEEDVQNAADNCPSEAIIIEE